MTTKTAFLKAFMEEIWNQKRFDKIETFVHPSYTVHLDTGDEWEGKTLNHESFKTRLKFTFDSFPDVHFDIKSTIEDENHVAITWIMTGTNTGNIAGFPPTGQSIKTNGMTIYHFSNNLISGHTQVFDRMIVMKQLGFM